MLGVAFLHALEGGVGYNIELYDPPSYHSLASESAKQHMALKTPLP